MLNCQSAYISIQEYSEIIKFPFDQSHYIIFGKKMGEYPHISPSDPCPHAYIRTPFMSDASLQIGLTHGNNLSR